MDKSSFSACLKAQTADGAIEPKYIVEMNLLLAFASLTAAAHAHDLNAMAKCAQAIDQIILPDMVAVGAFDTDRAKATAKKLSDSASVATGILSQRMDSCDCDRCARGRKVIADWLADEASRN